MSNLRGNWRSTFLYGSVAVSASAIGAGLAMGAAGLAPETQAATTEKSLETPAVGQSENGKISEPEGEPGVAAGISVMEFGRDILAPSADAAWEVIKVRLRGGILAAEQGRESAEAEQNETGDDVQDFGAEFAEAGRPQDGAAASASEDEYAGRDLGNVTAIKAVPVTSLADLPIETFLDGRDHEGERSTDPAELAGPSEQILAVQRPERKPTLDDSSSAAEETRLGPSGGATRSVGEEPRAAIVLADQDAGRVQARSAGPSPANELADPAAPMSGAELVQARHLAELQHRQILAQQSLLGEPQVDETVAPMVPSSGDSPADLEQLIDDQYQLIQAQDRQLRLQSRPTSEAGAAAIAGPIAPGHEDVVPIGGTLPVISSLAKDRSAQAADAPAPIQVADAGVTVPGSTVAGEPVLPLPTRLPEIGREAREAFDAALTERGASADEAPTKVPPELDPAVENTREPTVMVVAQTVAEATSPEEQATDVGKPKAANGQTGADIGEVAAVNQPALDPSTAVPPTGPAQSELEALRELVELQRQQIEMQRRDMAEQQQRIAALEKTTQQLASTTQGLVQHAARGGTYTVGTGPVLPIASASPGGAQPARPGAGPNQYAETDSQQTQQPVGEAPPEGQKPPEPEVPVIESRGGALTPPGTLVVEPSVEYAHSSINRFVFGGIEIADVVLVGQIEASDARRDSAIAAMTMRTGITDRLEVDVKVPYVRRDDRVTNLILPSTPDEAVTRTTSGEGLGDVEFGAHYQLNARSGDMPFYIANVRVKSDTGTGPFDVPRDSRGIETELPTGSGFWSVQPSITAILPSDPAVFFGNVGYVWNIERDIDTTISNEDTGDRLIRRVDPGDSIGGSAGVSLAVNRRASVSLGYKHNYIRGTETEFSTGTVESRDLHVGAFLLGGSYKITDYARVNLNFEIGATADSPDVVMGLRVPISFDIFEE